MESRSLWCNTVLFFTRVRNDHTAKLYGYTFSLAIMLLCFPVSLQVVKTAKCQCQDLVVESERGSINIGALYAQRSKFSSKGGSIYLGSCHGNSIITVAHSGDLLIGRCIKDKSYLCTKYNEIVILLGTEKHLTKYERGIQTITKLCF